MAKDVRQTLKNILVKFGNKNEDEAENFIVKHQKDGKYLSDTWF
jgi:sulfite reductase alpha subunit-like flavoprotein